MCARGAPVRSILMVEAGEDLLRRLAANDESSVRRVLALSPAAGATDSLNAALSPRVRMLVRLAALVALDASTTSLRWAVEHAAVAGADDDEIVAVLMSVGAEVGLPRVISTAPRLALAIGHEIDVEGWDGT
jgi:4-carboxymuconolactone decarboxylase